MKKVVIFGGGSGLSQLLKGIIQFPMDVTAVVSVSDNGASTGRLREEFAIPAVGDITKVLMAMSGESKGVKELFSYRFPKDSSIGNHSIKNLIMTALLDMKGNFAHSLPILCDLLDVKGKLLPLTEDNVDLIGITKEGYEIIGEAEITESKRKIKDLKYNKEVTVTPRVLEEIKKADLIIFSSGSLLTSVMPHIIVPEIQEAIKTSKAKTMYICNMLTQPGETDNYKVSDHIKVFEKYLGKGSIDVVIANNSTIPKNMALLAKSEGKDPVDIDEDKLEKKGIRLIAEKLFKVEEGYVRHDSLKTAYLIFSYLMEGE
ncbi:MAG: YvcK family protein [Firmicutes bacterium]|nr:YvcK family protein [Bacillota bacterium]